MHACTRPDGIVLASSIVRSERAPPPRRLPGTWEDEEERAYGRGCAAATRARRCREGSGRGEGSRRAQRTGRVGRLQGNPEGGRGGTGALQLRAVLVGHRGRTRDGHVDDRARPAADLSSGCPVAAAGGEIRLQRGIPDRGARASAALHGKHAHPDSPAPAAQAGCHAAQRAAAMVGGAGRQSPRRARHRTGRRAHECLRHPSATRLPRHRRESDGEWLRNGAAARGLRRMADRADGMAASRLRKLHASG